MQTWLNSIGSLVHDGLKCGFDGILQELRPELVVIAVSTWRIRPVGSSWFFLNKGHAQDDYYTSWCASAAKYCSFLVREIQDRILAKLPFSWIKTAGFLYFTRRCFSNFFRAQVFDVLKSIVNLIGNWLPDIRSRTEKLSSSMAPTVLWSIVKV